MRRRAPLTMLLCAALFVAPCARAQQNTINTLIGGGPNNVPALDADLNGPVAVAVDAAGNYYIAASAQNRVFKVDLSGTLTVVAGTGLPGYAGDGVSGGAPNALLNSPAGIAVDGSGNIYIADLANFVIRKVDPTNTITTVAGVQGACAYNGDGSPATSFDLCNPAGLAVDTGGNLYIADSENCRIRELTPAGAISTVAGSNNCGDSGDKGPATSAKLDIPMGVAVDSAGNIYIADTQNYVIREVTLATGIINSIAGNGMQGFRGDGGLATKAEIGSVQGIAVDSTGATVTIADSTANRMRQFTIGGKIATVAGDGVQSYCGDNGPALKACLNSPQGVALAGANIYVADFGNQVIRLFSVGGNISTVAGNGSGTVATPVNPLPPQDVVLNNPWGALADPAGNIYVADSSNCLVRELVRSTGLVDFFAGTGVCGYSGDGGPANQAQLGSTLGMAFDGAGNLYMADADNCVIRIVTSGNIDLFAGTPGNCAYSGDGGPATNAALFAPSGVFADSQNNVYIADSSNNVIRKVSAGIISTFAGDGGQGFLGDGGPAIAAELNLPSGVTGDAAGNLYIADTNNCVIRKVAVSGVITTVAGNSSCGFTGDGIATESELNVPDSVSSDLQGDLFIADTGNNLLRWVSSDGFMTTFAGNGSLGYGGDGGPATNAALSLPSGVTQDAAGNFLVADSSNFVLRTITPFAGLNSSANSLAFGLLTIGVASPPQIVTLTGVGPLRIGSISTTGDFSEFDDCPAILPNGQTCTVYVSFAATASGARTGTLAIEDNGYFNSATAIALAGTGSAISIKGSPAAFGNQAVKTTSAAKSVSITNKGRTAITMGAIVLSEAADFAISSNNCPASGSPLAARGKCTVQVTFTPQVTGAKKGALLFNDSDPSSPQVVGLSGTGVSEVTLTPSSVSFATEPIGITGPAANIVLTNQTGSSITLSSSAVSLTGPFHSGSGTTCTNGLVVPSNGTCVVSVSFRPVVTGFTTGTLSVTDTDASSPQTAALSGTGTGIQFKPASLNAGSAKVGSTVSANVTVINVGTTGINFTSGTISGAHAADFSTNAGEPPCNGSLPPGAQCRIKVSFRPSIVGAETATYQLYDNSAASPQSLPLRGTGQ